MITQTLKPALTLTLLLLTLPATTVQAASTKQAEPVRNPGLITQARDCTREAARPERLACFDAVFGTPVHVASADVSRAPGNQPAQWIAAYARESARQPSDGALYSRGDAGQMVTIAALGATPPRPLLSVRCDNNITHLALMLPQALNAERVRLTLTTDQREETQLWRVRDAGYVVSAGRGLPAIRTIKRLLGAPRITVRTNQSAIDGLVFDLANMRTALKPLRKTCGW